MTTGKGRKRHHLALIIAHIPQAEIVGLHAKGGIGLHIDFFYPSLMQEVVDIARAPSHRQGGVDAADRHSQRHGLFIVDVDVVLGRVFHAIGPDPGQAGILCRHAKELITSGNQLFMTQSCAVLEIKLKTRGCPQPADRR